MEIAHSNSNSVICVLLMLLLSFGCSRGKDLQDDVDALTEFLNKADPRGLLRSQWNSSNVCGWKDVITCSDNRITKIRIASVALNGTFPSGSLGTMDQLRQVIISYCGLTGAIPDVSGMSNLKHFYAAGNNFTGPFPASFVTLGRIQVLDFSSNSLSGNLPQGLTNLSRLARFTVQNNLLNGTIPAFNQSTLVYLNVSNNDFSGEIPETPVMARFTASSFNGNPGLCGAVLNETCSQPPALAPSTAPSSSPTSAPSKSKGGLTSKEIVIIVIACVVVVWAALMIFCYCNSRAKKRAAAASKTSPGSGEQMHRQEHKRISLRKSVELPGSAASSVEIPVLCFCAGEVPKYTLEDLLRASAEVLGRGTLGTTYKAVMEFMLIVAVKRLKIIKGDRKEFETYMESLGEIRHPNIVPLRAYFQAKEERLIVFDYEPNGSLGSLIYGTHSSKGKPLHLSVAWRIAVDVARGLSYLHQCTKFTHGNLKPTNILMGRQTEARIIDYGLTPLHSDKMDDGQHFASAYRAPEFKSLNSVGPKFDVYSYGVVLLEMLAGEAPPMGATNEWARRSRCENVDDDTLAFDGQFSDKLETLLNIALLCVSTSPNERPSMSGVLGMLEEGWERSAHDAGDDSGRYSASDRIVSDDNSY